MTKLHCLALALLTGLGSTSALAGQAPAAHTVSAAQRSAVIAALSKQLQVNYVFPEVATNLARALHENDARGAYADATDTQSFALALVQDLRSIGKDAHFQVGYVPEFHPDPGAVGPPSQEQVNKDKAETAGLGYGVTHLERLDGNVGYIELRGFGPTEAVGKAYDSAMELLSGGTAVIVDLRRNGGDEPNSVSYFMSHFSPRATRATSTTSTRETATARASIGPVPPPARASPGRCTY